MLAALGSLCPGGGLPQGIYLPRPLVLRGWTPLTSFLEVRPILPDDQTQACLRHSHPEEGSVEAAASRGSVDVVRSPALTTSPHQLSCIVLHWILLVKVAKDKLQDAIFW